MGDPDDVDDIVASGLALNQVSQWLGVSAEALLQEEDETAAHMFSNPHPQLVGLGAKYLSQKSLEKSGLEMKLKNRLKKSVNGSELVQHESERSQHQRKKQRLNDVTRASTGAGIHPQQAGSSDEEDAGKFSSLADKPGSGSHKQSKTFDRQHLLSVPTANLSKWQRKRMRQKEKKALMVKD